MKLSHESLLELMALADGELEGEAKARAEALAAESPEAQQWVEMMGAPDLGIALGEALEPRWKAAEGISHAVMERVGAERPIHAAASGVLRGPSVRPSRPRVRALAAVGVLAALAAGALLWIRSERAARLGQTASATAQPDLVVPGSPSPAAKEDTLGGQATAGLGPSQGVEVDEIDSPSRGVSVFEIPVGAAAAAARGAGPSTVVIMVDDDKGTP